MQKPYINHFDAVLANGLVKPTALKEVMRHCQNK
tara:strand:+ start:505 stop:606 length:102 start_codon:yes stop_codon:yes gene_type:complete